MKQRTYQVAFPAIFAVMVAFLCTIFFANADLSFAASGKMKSDKTTAVAYTEAQIKQLQDSLAITADQEVLWNNLTAVMRENAKDMDAFTADRAAADSKTMNAVEHMKFHKQINEAHLAQLNKFIPAFEAFYASMSDAQKQITDTIFRTGKYAKHKAKQIKK
jgi:hypothetical protein